MKMRAKVFALFFAALLSPSQKIGAADVVLSFTELVRIEGGMFTMGSPAGEPERSQNEGPRHHAIVDSFYIGRYEVTQREYEDAMGENPSSVKGASLPADCVSWYDAVEFCNRLSEWERLVPAYTIDKTRRDPNNKNEKDPFRWLVSWNRDANGYRLPTEAEWEYACRAGAATPFSGGNAISPFEANYNGEKPYHNNPKGVYRGQATEAGSFAPNPWGLYDMRGNAREWCWDWFADYTGDAGTNPAGPASGVFRAIRGGSYLDGGQSLRSAGRSRDSPFARESGAGFRVARNG